jgi:hypothetical protein
MKVDHLADDSRDDTLTPTQYVYLAAYVCMVYDYLLTLPDEVSRDTSPRSCLANPL